MDYLQLRSRDVPKTKKVKKKTQSVDRKSYKRVILNIKKIYIPTMQISADTLKILDEMMHHILRLYHDELKNLRRIRETKTLSVEQIELATGLILSGPLRNYAISNARKVVVKDVIGSQFRCKTVQPQKAPTHHSFMEFEEQFISYEELPKLVMEQHNPRCLVMQEPSIAKQEMPKLVMEPHNPCCSVTQEPSRNEKREMPKLEMEQDDPCCSNMQEPFRIKKQETPKLEMEQKYPCCSIMQEPSRIENPEVPKLEMEQHNPCCSIMQEPSRIEEQVMPKLKIEQHNPCCSNLQEHSRIDEQEIPELEMEQDAPGCSILQENSRTDKQESVQAVTLMHPAKKRCSGSKKAKTEMFYDCQLHSTRNSNHSSRSRDDVSAEAPQNGLQLRTRSKDSKSSSAGFVSCSSGASSPTSNDLTICTV